MSGNVLTVCPLDLEDGLARVGGELDFYKELLAMFLDDAPARLDELRRAVQQQDAAAIAGVAHSIKGAAANLSVTGVRDTALRLELSGRAGDLTGSAALVTELAQQIEELAVFLRTF